MASSRNQRPRRRRPRGQERMQKPSHSQRGWLLYLIFGFIVIVVIGRLVQLQLFLHSDYSQRASDRRTNNIELNAKRGTIYDRSGKVLAASVDAKTVYCNPQEVVDPIGTAKTIAQTTGGKPEDYIPSLMANKTFSYVAKRLDPAVAKNLADLELPGVYFLDDSKRIYPNGAVANQVIGAVSEEGEGQSGLELYYNDVLSGTDGALVLEVGSRGIPIAGGVEEYVTPVDGTDIVVSLDVELQKDAEDILVRASTENYAESGKIIVMNPENGEILAICSAPLPNLEDRSNLDPSSLNIKSVTELFEPGSTAKVFTAASALDAGTSNPNKRYELPVQIKVGDHMVSDAADRGGVNYSLTQIIAHSSNVGTVKVAQEIGVDSFREYLVKFGLNAPTGIDLPGEVSGSIPSGSAWNVSTLGWASFGQGISMTPIQLTRGVAVIANEGLMTKPHLLVSIGGDYVTYDDPIRIVDTAAAAKTAEMMTHVVTEGTAKQAQIDGYSVAAKTGTAQYINPDTGTYISGSYNISTIGFAPSTDPKVVVCVILDGTGAPSVSGYFKEMLEISLKVLDVPKEVDSSED